MDVNIMEVGRGVETKSMLSMSCFAEGGQRSG